MLRLRVETKPIIVRDTTLTKGETEKAKIKKEKAKIKKEKAEIKKEKAKIKKENTETKEKIGSLFFAIELVLAGIFLLVLICRK